MGLAKRLLPLVLVLAACNEPKKLSSGITWYEDDYPAALADAKASGRPILYDGWAPWCHVCLSMKSYVFVDPALRQWASRYVWLAIDTEKPSNAAATAKFPQTAWPTFVVIDPKTETVRARWLGAASLGQLDQFLDDGERLVRDAGDAALVALAEADALAAKGRPVEAAAQYAAALEAGGPTWPRRPDVLVSRAYALSRGGALMLCRELVREVLVDEATRWRTASTVDLAATGLACVSELAPDHPQRRALEDLAAKRIDALLAAPDATLSADDRGDALATLWGLYEERGDTATMKRYAAQAAQSLAAAAAAAPDPLAASTFNWARAQAHLALGEPEAAIALLQASERALPADYNPPAFLARVFKQLKRWDEGLAANARAKPLAYGPRLASIHGVDADLHEGKGDLAGARAAVEAQVAALTALPDGQKLPARLAAAKARLAKLDPTVVLAP